MVWSDLAVSNLLVSRNWSWRLGLVVCIFEDLPPCGSATSTGCLKTMAVVTGKISIP
jgi:hypothetical protein